MRKKWIHIHIYVSLLFWRNWLSPSSFWYLYPSVTANYQVRREHPAAQNAEFYFQCTISGANWWQHLHQTILITFSIYFHISALESKIIPFHGWQNHIAWCYLEGQSKSKKKKTILPKFYTIPPFFLLMDFSSLFFVIVHSLHLTAIFWFPS